MTAFYHFDSIKELYLINYIYLGGWEVEVN